MSAIISECGLYRYRLEREVQTEGKVFAYFGINPSTADASKDDQTVKKWIGFTLRNGGRKFIAGNVFALRATDVREVGFSNDGRQHADPSRPEPYKHAENLAYIRQIIEDADVLVPCWGNSSKVPFALRPFIVDLLRLLAESGKPVMRFGHTLSGDPLHPQMLAYATPLQAWDLKPWLALKVRS